MASSNIFAVDLATLNGSNSMVIVTVGQGAEQLRYQVHKNLILQYSRVIRNDFSTRSTNNTHTYTFTDCAHPSAFGLIRNWLYTQKLCKSDSPLDMMDLHKMHVLAFSLSMIKLQHDILAALITTPFPDKIVPLAQYIFRHSENLSKARKLFIDQCAFQLADDKWSKEAFNVPDGLALGVNKATKAHFEQLVALGINTGPKGAHIDYPRMLDVQNYLV
ncbi:hypothetical protein DL98DRAFT_582228 [Cadophora sp. DSE1049]|nr:hypothetical protein DL98DRAFT_582228 [Cadophora sp. DSE1049]